MIEYDHVDFGEDYQRIVAVITAVLNGDQKTTAALAEEIADDVGKVLHLVAFAATTVSSLLAELDMDVEVYLQHMGRLAATYNERYQDE